MEQGDKERGGQTKGAAATSSNAYTCADAGTGEDCPFRNGGNGGAAGGKPATTTTTTDPAAANAVEADPSASGDTEDGFRAGRNEGWGVDMICDRATVKYFFVLDRESRAIFFTRFEADGLGLASVLKSRKTLAYQPSGR